MVRIADCPYLTSPVYHGHKATNQPDHTSCRPLKIRKGQKFHKKIIRVVKGCILYIFKRLSIYIDISQYFLLIYRKAKWPINDSSIFNSFAHHFGLAFIVYNFVLFS